MIHDICGAGDLLNNGVPYCNCPEAKRTSDHHSLNTTVLAVMENYPIFYQDMKYNEELVLSGLGACGLRDVDGNTDNFLAFGRPRTDTRNASILAMAEHFNDNLFDIPNDPFKHVDYFFKCE